MSFRRQHANGFDANVLAALRDPNAGPAIRYLLSQYRAQRYVRNAPRKLVYGARNAAVSTARTARNRVRAARNSAFYKKQASIEATIRRAEEKLQAKANRQRRRKSVLANRSAGGWRRFQAYTGLGRF